LKWIIVDGPVDSLWIESMNSLLDDNKVLCLPNNERIQLGPHVKMVFEVDDLSQASPATVSRCGMIYFDPSTIPWTALADTWADTHKVKYEPLATTVRALMDQYVPRLLQHLIVEGKWSLELNPNFTVLNLLRLLDCFVPLMRRPLQKAVEGGDEIVDVDPLDQSSYFSMFVNWDPGSIPYFSEEQANQMFERVLVFCSVWAFGGVLVGDSRAQFDKFFRDLMEENQSRCPFPQQKIVFDFFLDIGRGMWIPWVDGNTNINLTSPFSLEEQFFPTPETASVVFIARLLMVNHIHTLVQGPESSKTLIAKTIMNSCLDKTKFSSHVMPLANCSTPSGISKFMISRMHRRQGALGPCPNQSLIFLVDNLGSVKPEIYGAQPPLELLRQFFGDGGWFNTGTVEFMNIANTLALIQDTKGNIFGGSTPVKWESRPHSLYNKADPSLKSFLFTLKNPHNVPARKFALKAEKKNKAICCNSLRGPHFRDIWVFDNRNANTRSYTNYFGRSYANNTSLDATTFLTGSLWFTVKEIEVFEITD
jgi:hypothetical protein